MNFRKSIVSRNAELNAMSPLFDDGYLRIYSGIQPATPEDAVTSQFLLAELRFGSPAFGSAEDGVLTANALTPDANAPASDVARWYRAFQSDGSTVLCDGDVGIGGSSSNLELNSVNVQSGAEVSVSAFTITDPMQGV